MSATVKIKTRNKKGGEFSKIKETAQAVIFVDNTENYISVDSYEGSGDTYNQRLESEIEIKIGSTIWKGSADKLKTILSVYNKFGK